MDNFIIILLLLVFLIAVFLMSYYGSYVICKIIVKHKAKKEEQKQ